MEKLVLRLIMVSLIVIVLTGVFLSTHLVTSAKTQGYVSIAFDDGNQNQYDNAYPLLNSRGMNATYYIITNRTNTPNYLTIAELQTLQNSGSEIGSHSVTHPDFSTLSDAQLQNECQLSKQTLQSWGLSVSDFAYPYGSRNSHSDSIIAKYYQSARSGYSGPFIMQVPTSQFLLPAFPGETGNSTALAKVESMVDQAYASNAWAIIFFHNVLPNPTGNFSMSTKDFASFLDYISSKGVRTLTVNQALNLGSHYKQYSLFLSTNSGIVSPSNGQYNESSTVTITATSLVASAGERYIWLGWLGEGAGSYTGINNPAQITMNGTITETAQWEHQYSVTLSSSGLASDAIGTTLTAGESTNNLADLPASLWIDSGFSLNFTYEPTIWSTTNMKQFVLANVNASSPLVITVSTTVMATYKTQYYLTVNSPYGATAGSGWYDGGTNADVTLYPSTLASFPGTQYAFTGWRSSDSSSITIASNDTSTTAIINGPGIITANFETTPSPVGTTDTTGLIATATTNPTTTPPPTKTPTLSNSPANSTSSTTNSTPMPTTPSQTPSPAPNTQTKENVSTYVYGLVAIVTTTVVLFPITVINKKREDFGSTK